MPALLLPTPMRRRQNTNTNIGGCRIMVCVVLRVWTLFYSVSASVYYYLATITTTTTPPIPRRASITGNPWCSSTEIHGSVHLVRIIFIPNGTSSSFGAPTTTTTITTTTSNYKICVLSKRMATDNTHRLVLGLVDRIAAASGDSSRTKEEAGKNNKYPTMSSLNFYFK